MPDLLCLYYFNGEVGESHETPNAFVIPGQSSSSVTLATFVKHFPMKSVIQSSHFRFKEESSSDGYVWRDVISAEKPLPTYQNQLFAKIIRMDNEVSSKRKMRLRRKKDVFWGNGVTAATSMSSSISIAPSKTSGKSHSSAKQSSAKINANVKAQAKAQAQAQGPVEDLLTDASDFSPQGTNNDMFADFAYGSNDSSGIDIDEGSAPTAPPVTLNRQELAAKREAGVQEKVKEALEFKHEQDEALKRENSELDEAKMKHDKVLTSWGIKNNEKANIRNLLTSMHTVLWPDSGWKPVGLGDVIESKKVKLFYRKAMLVVHPDRCSSSTAEVRFIAKRVFEAVNEAYQDFLKKEGLE